MTDSPPDRSTISWLDLSKEEIEELAEEQGYASISAYIRDLVKEDAEIEGSGGAWD